MDEVEAVKAAIKLASCPGREGPFGGYDYGHNEAFYGPAPEDGRYVIRDFRDRKSPGWGKWLHQTDNREEHEAMFVKMTDDHIAHAAIAALDAARGDQVARKDRPMNTENWTFRLGDRVTKTKGSSWTGRVVGFYSTTLTPEGYAIESDTETGSVQIYPVGALKEVGDAD